MQIISSLSTHDGASGCLLGFHEAARRAGLDSFICTRHATDTSLKQHLDPRLSALTRLVEESSSIRTTFVYHYGMLDHKIDAFFREVPVFNRLFFFHNVTPIHHYKGWDPGFADVLKDSRNIAITHMRDSWIISGASQFNIDELPTNENHILLPPVKSPSCNKLEPLKPTVLETKACTDMPTMLFVGRFTQHKRQDVLLYLMRDLLSSGMVCRLILAGKGEGPYIRYLKQLVRTLRLGPHVRMLFDVDAGSLATIYKLANYFVLASEHEGYCTPIFEALHYGLIPIARPFAAIRETMDRTSTLASDTSLESFFKVTKENITSTFQSPRRFRETRCAIKLQMDQNLSRYLDADGFIESIASQRWLFKTPQRSYKPSMPNMPI